MVNILLVCISVSLAIVGQLSMKYGMNIYGKFPVTALLTNLIPMFLQPYVFFGIFCFGISSIFWLVVLSRMELSLVYPMASVAYVAVALFSYFVFKENVTMIRWMGILTICLGVILVSRS
jgi:multidrug transporter EmrE-like cation transporter